MPQSPKMIKRIKSAILMALIIQSSVMADQTGKISGAVRDTGTDKGLIGANVIINERWVGGEIEPLSRPLGAATDLDGRFYILNLEPGFYNVEAHMMGYQSKKIEMVRIDVDKTTEIFFDLSSESLLLDDILVTAFRSDMIQKDLTATKQNYIMSELEEVAGIYDVQDIIDLNADIVEDNVRGGREAETQYLIGGASIVNPLSNKASFKPMTSGLQAVEVFTSGFSAEYGNAQSGVINMVPKTGGKRWSTKVNYSGTLAHYNHWGGSAWSEDVRPHNLFGGDAENWLQVSQQDSSQSLINWNSNGSYANYVDLENATHEDSLKVAQFARAQYLAFARQIGLSYDEVTDYRIDLSTGGPVSDKTRIFLAVRQQVDGTKVLTAFPNKSRQLMSNFSWAPDFSNKLIISLNYFASDKLNWSVGNRYVKIFNPDYGPHRDRNQAADYGLRWEHIFSKKSYMEMNLRSFTTDYAHRYPVRDPEWMGSNFGSDFNTPIWLPGDLNNKVLENSYTTEETSTLRFYGSWNKQLNMGNLIKAGWQLFSYDLRTERSASASSPNAQILTYHEKPYEGAFYVQDKMEFEGLVANIGLRFDFYNYNYEYFTNLFHPTANPNYDASLPPGLRGPFNDPELAETAKTELVYHLQPRLGFSYPVNDRSVIHVNYGSFTQRPNFDKIYRRYYDITGNEVDELGNARLKPERTNAYDFGLVQGLPFGFRLNISTYYKDVKNLVQTVFYEDSTGSDYKGFANLDYANIKGFSLSLVRKQGNFNMSVRYNFQKAIGKNPTPFDATLSYKEGSDGRYDFDHENNRAPEPEDVIMNYNRRNRIITNIGYKTPSGFGPQIFGVQPISGISVNTKFTFQEGRPYTYYGPEEAIGTKFNKVGPDENNLQMKIAKNMRFGKQKLNLNLTIFNVLNEKVYAYSLFKDFEAIEEYEAGDIDAVMVESDYSPMDFPQHIRYYQNAPRYFRLGVQWTF